MIQPNGACPHRELDDNTPCGEQCSERLRKVAYTDDAGREWVSHLACTLECGHGGEYHDNDPRHPDYANRLAEMKRKDATAPR